jgi:hypothetical protein
MFACCRCLASFDFGHNNPLRVKHFAAYGNPNKQNNYKEAVKHGANLLKKTRHIR